MIYLLAGLLSIALVVVLNGAAVLSGRAVAVRLLGLGEARVLSIRPSPLPASVPLWKRALVVMVPVAAAYLQAGCLHAAALRAAGRTSLDPDGLGAWVAPVPDKPAASAGVRPGDRIVKVGSAPIARWPDLAPALQQHAGKTVELLVERDGQEVAIPVAVPETGRIGVMAVPVRRELGVGEALAEGFASPWKTAAVVVRGLFGAPPDLSGPVAIAAQPDTSAQWEKAFTAFAFANATYGLLLAIVFAFVTRARRQGSALHH